MQVAFLGLGAMGRPMAANLAKVHDTVVWNRTTSVAAAHSGAHGTTVAESLDELDRTGEAQLDVVASCLPTDREVAEVATVLGPRLAPGTVWLDHTSGSPAGSRQVAAQLADEGVHYLDAPVSGGVAGAESGELTVMIGGEAEQLVSVQPVLDAVAARVVHVGPVGAGMAVKAINNVLLATSLWAAAEGLTALQASGVDPAVALEVVNAGTGRSFATETLIPERVLTREFPRTFALGLLAKDVGLAQGVLEEAGVDSEVVALVNRLTAAAASDLGGEVDHVELVRQVERSAGVELRGGAH